MALLVSLFFPDLPGEEVVGWARWELYFVIVAFPRYLHLIYIKAVFTCLLLFTNQIRFLNSRLLLFIVITNYP